MIDLHAHTTASDGVFEPEALVLLAHRAGVRHLAVTDHDTVEGLARAEAKAAEVGMELICGIEVSTQIEGRDIHVLGLFVRRAHPSLLAYTQHQRGERRRRMERMVEKLNRLGHAVTMAQVERIAGSTGAAGEENFCRPHLARALMELGVCRTMQDAFTHLIGDGGPAFAEQERLSAREAISLIVEAGGVAALAHPAVDGMDRYHIRKLREWGMGGLEVFHPDHDGGKRVKYLKIARENDLLPTGGSDFHGDKNAAEAPVMGAPQLDAQSLEALRARAGVSL